MRSDALLLDLAVRQGGVIREEQALTRGLSKGAIFHRLKTGQWRRVARSTYRLIGMSDGLSRTRAAVTSLPGAVASHETAAEIHSIPHVRRGMAVVTVHSQTTHSFPDVVVHRSHDLSPDHIDLFDDLPVTNLPRTIVDLAALLRRRHLAMILDDLIASKRVTIDDVQGVASIVIRRGKPGSAVLRGLIEERRSMPNSNASRLEISGLATIRDALLPEPEMEYSTQIRRSASMPPTQINGWPSSGILDAGTHKWRPSNETDDVIGWRRSTDGSCCASLGRT